MTLWTSDTLRDLTQQRDAAREGQRQLVRELESVRRAAQRQGFVIAFLACGVGFTLYAFTTWLIEVCR